MIFRKSLLLLMLPAAILASDARCSSEKPAKPPSIVLISVDDLRADYFTAERMPLLRDFAKNNCRVYTNAHSNSTWSRPSHATMLSGLLQSQHGVEYESSAIPSGLTMIQQKLKKAGYTTAAFVDGEGVGRRWGFDRGFDRFSQSPGVSENPEWKDAAFKERFGERETSLDEAERFLMSHPEQPVFLLVHTRAVADYRRGLSHRNTKASRDSGMPRPDDDSPEEYSPEKMQRLYAAAVLGCDKKLDRFLTVLKHSSIFPNAKLIITSAHGEGLGDVHEGEPSYGHANPPYSDQVDVPLMIYGAGRGETNRLVGLDDVAGTILKLAGVEREPAKSVFRERNTVVSEYVPQDGEKAGRAVAIISAKRKFLIAPDGNVRLFRDPKDSVDLIRLRQAELTKEDISEGLKQQLNALGYLQ